MSEMMDRGFTVYGQHKGDKRLVCIPAWFHVKTKQEIILKIIQGLRRATLQQSFSRPISSSYPPSNLAHLPNPNLCSLMCRAPPQLWKFSRALFPPLLYLAIPMDHVTSPSKPLLKQMSSILCSATTSLHDLFGAPYSISSSTTPGHPPFPYILHHFSLPTSEIQTAGCYMCEDSILHSWFQTFAVFWLLYAFFWAIPRCLNFICQWNTLFHLHRQVGTHLWRWNRQSVPLAYKIQMSGNYPEESIQ
jgi:hypothetical protein